MQTVIKSERVLAKLIKLRRTMDELHRLNFEALQTGKGMITLCTK